MAYNKGEKLRDNIAAIRVAFDVERSGRAATEQEKAMLRRFSGFGGLKFILNPCEQEGDIELWSRSDRPFFAATRELYALLREQSHDEAEYKQLATSIRNSILTAFYTPSAVVEAIARVLKHQGVEVHSYLDPSAGKGTFVEAFKNTYPGVSATAFEKDLITGKVLKALYPQDHVHISGFERIDASRQGTYDVVSSNIPFGDISVFDDGYARSGNAAKAAATKTIHNYFFLKSLDQLREGGFVAFITSRGFMDSPSNNAIRKEIICNARLVGAFRLPDGLFSDEAGTEVGSDLVILQKYTGYDSSLDPDSLAFCEVSKGFQAANGEDFSGISLNTHWWKSMLAPDSEAIISTKMEIGTDPYGKQTLVCTNDGGILAISDLLSAYMSRDLNRDFVDYYNLHAPKARLVQQEQVLPRPQQVQARPAQQEQPVQLSLFDLWADETSTKDSQQPSMEPRPYTGDVLPHYRNGIIVEDGGQVGHLTNVGYDVTFTPIALSEDQAGRMKLYAKVRDAYELLYKEETDKRVEQPLLREELNRRYDNFLVRYGHLNERKNARVLLMDAQGRDVLSLENSENGHFVKSDIFLRPVSFNVQQDGHVETASDALSASLNRTGGVDLEYMASISDFSEEELRDQLKERIFFNPLANGYEIGDKFLAGNVVEKLDELRRWPLIEDMKPDYKEELERSISALESVIPTPITYDELDFNFGERWMPKNYFSEFASEFFGTDIHIDYAPQLDEFVIDVSGHSARLSQEFAVTGETKTYDGEDMLRHALYNTVPVINKCVGYKPNGDPIMGPDHEKIQLAASKIDQIRDAFTDWIDRHPDEWKNSLADLYNRKYNCFVKARYDGSHQTFPGLDLKGLAVSKYQIHDIYKSQKDCVWMLLQNGGGVCDHEVGTGKTMTMCIAAHEMKRLGLAHKPIIIGMKANVAEIAATYQAAYPGDRILYATQKDFSDRQNFFNRMKNNDYDCIIMSHDQFTMIPQSSDIQRKVIQEEVDAIDEALAVYARQGHSVSGRMRSGLEKRKANLTSQLLTLNATLASRADDVVDFKTMGIDHIFIDESQAFKNLAFTTRDSRVAGLGDPKGSQRARNLQYAIRTIQERTGRDLGATFLSGTTISNSLTELYLLFKYLRPKAMSMQDINSFDAWAAVFARKSRDYEINVAGSIVMKERFRQFIKVPELGAFYNEITDYKTAADVGLERPDMDVQLVNIPPTEDQQDFQQRLLQFAESGDGDLVFRAPLSDSEEKAKMLIVTNLGKKCSLSPKLVNPAYHEGDDTKIGVAAKIISELYHRYEEQRGTQFVFCDLSTPKKGEWSVYQELKDRLVSQYGIPADEIQFIQDAGTEKKKKEFIDRMNRGDIRVMIGSTTMLGTGVNAQRRAVAVHHLDLPWRPSDMEQRNGRARRKGNEVARDYADNQVKVFVYAVERSLDSYNFYLLQAKSEFIRQMKTGALAKRSFDQGGESEDSGMPFAEYVAITSGNNDLLERAKLEKRILGMDAERKAFYKQQQVTQQKLSFAREQVRHFDIVLERLNSDKASLEHTLVSSYGSDADIFAQIRNNPSPFTFLPGDDPQLSRVHLDLSQPNPYGDYLQQAARHEVNGEVVVARLVLDGTRWPLVMTSKTEYNPNTGVNRWVGNKLSVEGPSGLHYTYSNGKVSLSDKALAARFPFAALSRIPDVISDQERQRKSYAVQIPELERIAGKQWEKAAQLSALKEQLQALDRKIQQDLDGRVAQASQAVRPEELPFTIEHKQWGRSPWELQFKLDDYPYQSRADREVIAEKYHGRFRTYDGNVIGNFQHQFGAEEAMKELSRLNALHKDDVEWLKAAVKDVHDESCIPSVRRLRELGLDRFGRPLTGDNAKSLRAVSLGDYRDERVRAIAHGIKDGNDVAIGVAASAMAKALAGTPVSKTAVLVSMPGHKGYGGSAQRLAKRLSELSGIPYVDALSSGEHESLYDWKKEHPGEELPELFFTEDEHHRIPEGKTPIIIDNVIDTGHTAWAAVEALEAQPILFTVGSTGHEDSEGHAIRLRVHQDGLHFIEGSMPEGVGLTGLSQEEFDSLLHKAQAEDSTDARRDLRKRGVDWHTGQPSYLVAHIVDKWDMTFSEELDPFVRELTGKGAAEKVFSEEELRHLSREEKSTFDALLKEVSEKSLQGYSYQQLNDKRRLMVVHDYLKEKAAKVIEKEQENKLRYDVATNTWSGIPSDIKVFCSGEPDRIREVYGYTPNEDIDLVFYKADRTENSHAFVRVWVDDHQAETPAKIVIQLEKEGYDVGLHGERGRYVDFGTWDEAVRFEQHVRDLESEVHAVKAEANIPDSPLLRQFHDLKSKHPDALLLFRVGDFYETYEQDAVEASRILGITLIRRSSATPVSLPKNAMAGFPYHALDTYLPKLIRAGKRVAICDQLEALKANQKRGITEMVQPGLRPRLQLVDSLADMRKVLPHDAILRDALMERMREAGIRVNTDVASSERILSQEAVRLHQPSRQPLFVSNARRAVEHIRQEKATPGQWLRMIERAGGIKVGEDRWMGLSLWLMNSKERTLTKGQVLDYVAAHEIKVEEVHYQASDAEVHSTKLDQMNEEFYELMGEAEDATGSLYVDDYARWAWERMVERYGNDFRLNTQYDNDPVSGWHLKPFEWYEGEGPAPKAAAYYGIDRTINSTRMEYTTGGLENKREIALVVPGIESWRESDDIHFGDAGGGRAVAWVRFGDAVSRHERSESEIQDIIRSMPSGDEWQEVTYYTAVPGYRNFYNLNRNSLSYADCILEKDGSYTILFGGESPKVLMNGEKDIAALKRAGETFASLDEAVKAYNEFVARRDRFVEERTLVIDEIQSQRHQEGRERGYNTRINLTGYAVEPDDDGNFIVTHPDGVSEDGMERVASRLIRSYEASSPEKAMLLAARLDQNVYASSRVPAAPFEKNWHELAMKRMLRYAAENGYDRVAWTTGNQQAERYNLGDHIDFLTVEPYEPLSPSESQGFDVSLHTRGMATVDLFVTRDGIIQSGGYGGKEDYFAGQQLSKVVGRALSEKILAAREWQRFDSDDLHVGAEGMNTFYDHILVNFMDRYARQWGVHTEDVELLKLDISGKMHSVAVTPQMREDVRKGQPMFFIDGNRQAYGFTYNGEIYVDRRVATAETPLHEYTHLWAEVLRERNPEEWKNIVSLMKGCPELWKEVSERYGHLHDESDIAEEVLAHYSGRRGYQRLMDDYGHRQDVSGRTILGAITDALNRLWKSVADFLHIHYTTKEQVADQVLCDLLNRVNPNDYRMSNSARKTVSRHLSPADREAGGALVDQLERMGISVHTDYNENRRILKAALRDNSEVGKVRHFKTQAGTAYGFAYKGELHLDLRRIDAELPLHEYAHLWCEALRRVNPDNWNRVVSMIRDDAASWQFVRAAYPELHDADDIAEEVIAQYSGRRGAEKLRDELARMTTRDDDYGSRWGNVFQNVSKAIQDFWQHVGDSLNIRYDSAEDVYDQILNDFARKVNPVAKVERYLKERDRIYQDCVEGGDLDTAAVMFEEALQEHIGSGVTPFMAVDGYRGKLDRLAREVKGGSDDAIRRAVRLMAPLVPSYSVLVPAPSHTGAATDMLVLANALSEETGAPVADVLKGNARERQYDVKKTTGRPMAAEAMGIRMVGTLPEGYMPVVIDNVVHSGNTAEACVRALGKGVVLALASAVSQERHVSSLKSLEPVVYDKNGVLVPLSERFSLKSKYLGRVMAYRPLGEVTAGESLAVAEPLLVDIRSSREHSPYEHYLGSKALCDAVLSLSERHQKLVAGYEDPASGDIVFVGANAIVMHEYDKDGSGRFSQRDGHDAVFRMKASGERYHSLDVLSPRLIHDGYNIACIGKEKVNELMKDGQATLQSLSRPVVRSAVQLELFQDTPVVESRQETSRALLPSEGLTHDLTALHLRDLADGEQCFVERRYRENGFFSFVGGESIESAEDVAYIFKSLEDQCVENSFLAMVKDGKPLVIHLGIGTYSEVPAPIEKALVAFNSLKPEKVWFIHNHPSGSLKASFLDMKMHQRMQDVFGDAVQPSIIIDTTSGKFGVYTDADSESQLLPDRDEGLTIPVPTYQFDRQVFSKGWNPELSMTASAASLASFVSSHRLGERDKLSLIVLDQARHITGNVFLPWNNTKDIVEGNHVRTLAGYTHQMGGNRCIIYGSEDGVRMTDTKTMSRLSKQLKAFGVRVEDFMSVSRSAFQEGIFYANESDTVYGIAGDYVIDETVRPVQGLENYSEEEIRKYVREYFESVLEGTDIDVDIVDMKVIGSRATGKGNADSDLDILLEYKGDISEDGLFNILNDDEDRLYIEGIPVDINPITEGKSGTIREFLERNADYEKADSIKNQSSQTIMESNERSALPESSPSEGTGRSDIDDAIGRLLSRDDIFRYKMLDRLRVDCNYYLGHGGRYEGSLWAGNVLDHIRAMKALWYSLPEKPVWLPMEKIDQYAKDMRTGEESQIPLYTEEQSAVIKKAVCDYLQQVHDDYYPNAAITRGAIDAAVYPQVILSLGDAERVSHDVSVELLLRAEEAEPGVVERYTGESLGTEARHMASDAATYADAVLYNREYGMERKLDDQLAALNEAVKVFNEAASFISPLWKPVTSYSLEKKDDAHFALVEHDSEGARYASSWVSAVEVASRMETIQKGLREDILSTDRVADEFVHQEFIQQLDILKATLDDAVQMIADKISVRPVTVELCGENVVIGQIEEINGRYHAGNSLDLLSDITSYGDATKLNAAVREAQMAHLLGNGIIDFTERVGMPQKIVNDDLTHGLAYIQTVSCHDGQVSITGAIDNDGTPSYIHSLRELQPEGMSHLVEEVRKVVQWKPELNMTIDQALLVAQEYHLYEKVEQEIMGGMEPELALQKYHIMPTAERLAMIEQQNDIEHLPPVDALYALLAKAIPNDGDVLNIDMGGGHLDLQYQSFGWQQMDDVKYIRHVGDRYVAGNGDISIDVGRLASGPDGDYLVTVVKDHIKLMENKTMEEKKQEEAQVRQEQQPEQKKRGWNIDYTKYSMPEGVSVENARVFKLTRGDNEGKYAVSAVIDGQRKTQVMYKNDVDAYFARDEQGNRKPSNPTAEQLVAKYFSSKTLEQPVPVKEEGQEQQVLQEAEKQQDAQARQEAGKRKGWNIDYTKYSMPEGAVVTNPFVKKDDKSGKYRLFATINGEFRSADLYPNDRQAFFEKGEDGERKASLEQLVAKYFAKSTAEKMGVASAAQQPQQETRHLGTYDVPVWALAALQNGTDAYDSLQEDEIAEIEHFQEQFDGPLSFDIHSEERNEFNPSPAFGDAGETVKVDVYTFVEKVNRAQAEVRENLEEKNVAEDNEKELQERKDAEMKKQEDGKKEDKQDVSAGLALQTALLVGALHAASDQDGVWMNRQGKQAPAFMGKDTKISPFNTLVMALHSDANGYKSNLYTTFAAAKNEGISVRGKEKGLPYNWYDWDKFVNKYIKNEVIDRAAYQALPPEERELYRVQGKKDMKPIFNIDQTTLPMQKKEEYKSLVGVESKEQADSEKTVNEQASRQERFAEMTKEYPDTIKLFRVDDGYEIYGEDAKKAASVIGLPLVKGEDGSSASLSFPKEDLDTYLPMLVHANNKVAFCDDLEDARLRRLTPEGELYATSDKLVAAIQQTGVDIDSNGATRYDAGKNTLYVADRTQSKPGQEMTLAMERLSDVYRATVAYTGTDDRLNRGNRERMLPEDRDKYDRLVQELAAGVMMTRQGLPATISEKNRGLIPYWERELKEDPKLLDRVERDVNNAVQVIDKVVAGQQVDYAAIRGERPAVMARPRMYTIASELATIPNTEHRQVVIVRDPKEKTAAVILPSGASTEMNNEVPGMNRNRFVVALKHQGIDDVKFYNAGGALGLNQPNEFFAGKEVEVAHLKQYELIQDETIDLTDELARTSQVDIEKVMAIKDDQEEWVFYVKPAEGESVTIKPETTDLARFFSAIQTEQFDNVRQELGQKYYALAQQHPQLKQDFIMPKVENVDLSRITSALMYKSKYHENMACVTCTYDDNKKLSTEISRDTKEWQRLWLADDQKGYKVAVAAKLFEAELNKGQEKVVEQTREEPVRETEEVTIDDDQEEVEEEQQTVRNTFHR